MSCIHPSPNFYCTHIVTKGHVRCRTANGVDTVVGPGDLFSLWRGIGHTFSPEPPCRAVDIDMDWIRLSGPLARQFMRTLGTTEENPCGPAKNPKRVAELMRKLQQMARSYNTQTDMLSIAVLHEIAAACGYSGEPAQKQPSLAERIRDAMDMQLDSAMNIEGYARAFGISRSLLFLEFKKHFGASPVRILNGIRIERARSLLTSTELSITEIAAACGDDNPLYFSKRFHKACGMSPTEYREKHGK
jgi:AraC-like DNA-binding protein